MANLDTAFLSEILRLDAILRTVGWNEHRNWKLSVIRAVRSLEDNGYDTVVSAILRGYNVDRRLLDDPTYADVQVSRLVSAEQQTDDEESWALFYPGGDTSITGANYTHDEALAEAQELANRERRAIEIFDVQYGDVETVNPTRLSS